MLDEVIAGEGQHAMVRPAICSRNGEKVAVKIINRMGLTDEDEEDLRREVAILKRMRHPNIVKMRDFFEEPMTYIIVMEYIEGGELFDRIVKKEFYNEKEARDCVYIILSAVKYIHDRDVVHRDLKPENLLLKSDADDYNIKLADFGLAVDSTGETLTTDFAFSGYTAPEIISRRPYGKPADMWSVGVITYILLGGYPPFHHENKRELSRLIQSGAYEFHPENWVHLPS